MPANKHHIGIGLGHARGHRAHARATDQFHTDLCAWIDLLEVIDELRQILDRINIMVRWRRNKGHPRHAKTKLGNHRAHLVPRQLTSLTGLGSLRHLDLNLLGTGQIFWSHTKTTAGDLFDGAVLLGAITLGIFASLTTV